MDAPSDEKFPSGSLLKRLEGSKITINAHTFHLKSILSEYVEVCFCERRAEFQAEDVKTRETVRLDFRVEIPPLPDQPPTVHHRAIQLFNNESNTFKDLSPSGHTAAYITHAEMKQDENYEYPGGYLNVLALGWYPDVDFDEAILDIPRTEMEGIKRQFVEMFSSFYEAGYEYLGIPCMYKYDPEKKIVYASIIEMFDTIDCVESFYPLDAPSTYNLRNLLAYVAENTGKNVVDEEDESMRYDADWWV